jgi:hypothetical protein
MGTEHILMFIGTMLFSIIGYFLKITMDDLRKVKDMTIQTKSELDILKNDHTNKYEKLTEKVDDIREDIKEVKELIKNIGK